MAKYSGKIGYVTTTELEPGYWGTEVTEQNYYGDIIKNITKYNQTNNINDDISFNISISIVADRYAKENSQFMKYVYYNGIRLKIINIEPQYPRLILTLGGIYNA